MTTKYIKSEKLYHKIKATKEGGVLLLNSAVYLVVKVFYCADIEG